MIRLLKFFGYSIVAIVCGLLLVLSGAYLYLSPGLPSVEALRSIQLQIPLRVYSSDEKLIAEFGEMRRTPIRFADIPPNFINALLSAEDDNFANHYGVDPSSLVRAATQLVKSGHIQSGGSTITDTSSALDLSGYSPIYYTDPGYTDYSSIDLFGGDMGGGYSFFGY